MRGAWSAASRFNASVRVRPPASLLRRSVSQSSVVRPFLVETYSLIFFAKGAGRLASSRMLAGSGEKCSSHPSAGVGFASGGRVGRRLEFDRRFEEKAPLRGGQPLLIESDATHGFGFEPQILRRRRRIAPRPQAPTGFLGRIAVPRQQPEPAGRLQIAADFFRRGFKRHDLGCLHGGESVELPLPFGRIGVLESGNSRPQLVLQRDLCGAVGLDLRPQRLGKVVLDQSRTEQRIEPFVHIGRQFRRRGCAGHQGPQQGIFRTERRRRRRKEEKPGASDEGGRELK